MAEYTGPRYYRELGDRQKQQVSSHAANIRKHVLGRKPTTAQEEEIQQIKVGKEYTCLEMRRVPTPDDPRPTEWVVAELNGFSPPTIVLTGFSSQLEAIDEVKRILRKAVSVTVPNMARFLKPRSTPKDVAD